MPSCVKTINTFIHAKEFRIRRSVIRLMYIYAGTLGKLGKTEEKIAVLNDIISAFGHHTRAEIVEPLTRAIFTLGKLLWMLGRQNEALDTLKTAETYCDIKDEAVLANIVHALWGRAFYLEMLNKGDDEIRASKFKVT